MKEILKAGFVGAGDWGGIFFNFLKIQNNIDLDCILTADHKNNPVYETGDIISSSLFDKYIFYTGKDSYNHFSQSLDVIIVAGWSYKIPVKVINNFSFPILNIHASLLPKYRGPEPAIQQLLHEEKTGGVTIHKIDAGWDTGDICEQSEFEISVQDDNKTLFVKAGRTGIKALKKVITGLYSGSISFIKQNNLTATYYPKINILDYVINHNHSMRDVVKYCSAFRGAYPLIADLNGKLISINEFAISNKRSNDTIAINLSDGFLIIKKYFPYK